ncbi:MAG: periplasmic heavy metal sensor [Desulfomonilaceae bacterium]
MRFTKASVLAVPMMLLLMASTAFAQQMGCCFGGMGRCAARLDLTADQQKQVTALRNELFKKLETLRSDLAQKRIQLMELASKDNPDEQAIEKKRQEVWSLKDSMRNERRAMSTKFRALLTPEQKRKLASAGLGFGGMGLGGRCNFGGQGCGGCPGRLSRF